MNASAGGLLLQTPPRDDALALLLAFGSAWWGKTHRKGGQNLAVGLAPTNSHAMPGAHVRGQGRTAAKRSVPCNEGLATTCATNPITGMARMVRNGEDDYAIALWAIEE